MFVYDCELPAHPYAFQELSLPTSVPSARAALFLRASIETAVSPVSIF